MLSHVAVTSLLIHNQIFKYKHVTDDSKFSLFNSLVGSTPLSHYLQRGQTGILSGIGSIRPKDDEEPDLRSIRDFMFAQQMKYLTMEIKKYKEAENKKEIKFIF